MLIEGQESTFEIKDNVHEEIVGVSNGISCGFYTSMVSDFEESKIISPLEQLFYLKWALRTDYLSSPILLNPQTKIGKYRVDFSLNFLEFFIGMVDDVNILEKINKNIPLVAIEIDGHDFHEKTKKQVESDKKRERFLIKNGWVVIRFSGTEVFKDALYCVNEVYEQYYSTHRKILRKLVGGGYLQ